MELTAILVANIQMIQLDIAAAPSQFILRPVMYHVICKYKLDVIASINISITAPTLFSFHHSIGDNQSCILNYTSLVWLLATVLECFIVVNKQIGSLAISFCNMLELGSFVITKYKLGAGSSAKAGLV